jgi:glycosyltransferase involved in cell wall biosynthesis
MKIVFVTTGLQMGGAEMMLFNIVSNLDRQRFDALVINLGQPGSVQLLLEKARIPVRSLGINSFFSVLPGLLALAKQIRAFQPDVTQGWMYHANLMTQIAKRIAGDRSPLLWGIRYSLTDLSQDKCSTVALIRGGAKLSGSPTRIVYNSVVSAAQHEKIGYPSAKRVVIANGVDLQRWKPDPLAKVNLRRELRLSDATPLIGLIGRLDPAKDHETFFQAAALVKKNNPDVHFVLAGTGVEPANVPLNKRIHALGLESKTHLLG